MCSPSERRGGSSPRGRNGMGGKRGRGECSEGGMFRENGEERRFLVEEKRNDPRGRNEMKGEREREMF